MNIEYEEYMNIEYGEYKAVFRVFDEKAGVENHSLTTWRSDIINKIIDMTPICSIKRGESLRIEIGPDTPKFDNITYRKHSNIFEILIDYIIQKSLEGDKKAIDALNRWNKYWMENKI